MRTKPAARRLCATTFLCALICFLAVSGLAQEPLERSTKLHLAVSPQSVPSPAPLDVTAIQSDEATSISFPATTVPVLYNDLFSVNVPAGTAKLEVKLVTSTPDADLDLYVRYAQDVNLDNVGDIIADQKSEVIGTGNESITVSAESIQGLAAGTYYIAVGIFTLGETIDATVTAKVTTPTGLVAPQFVSGAGWSTSLFLTNLSNTAEGFEVRFYNDSGVQRPVPFTGLGLASSFQGTLNPGETRVYETLDTGILDQGSAIIIPDNPVANRISGFAIFRERLAGQPDFEAVVGLGTSFDKGFVLLYDDTSGFQSGVALTNASSTPVDISVTVRGQDGQMIGTAAMVPLEGFGHQAFFLYQLNAAVTGQKGSVSFSANSGFAALGLRFSPVGPFTSFPPLLTTNTE